MSRPTARTREPAWGERRNEVAIDLPEHVLDDLVQGQALFQVLLGLLIPVALGALVTGTVWGAVSGFLWGGVVRMFAVEQAIVNDPVPDRRSR